MRDPRAQKLFPIPSHAIEHAEATAVATVDWELTRKSAAAYDIQVEDDAGFIAEGVVVHNSSVCRERDGVVLPQEHAWWQTNYPPLHMRCRAGVRSLRRSEAEKRGITTEPPNEGAPEGWGLTPDAQPVWKPDPTKHDSALRAELDRKKLKADSKRQPKAKPDWFKK